MKHFLISLFLILSFPGLALAASPKDIPTGNGINPDEARMVKPLIGRLFGGKVFIGNVVSVVNKTITATQADGTSADVVTTEVTKYLKAGRAVNLNGLVPGDQIFALGATASDGTFIAKSVVAKAKVLKTLKKSSYLGTVTGVSDSSFTLKSLVKGEVVEITVNSQTQLKQNGKRIALATLAAGVRVVVIALKEDDGSLTGQMVVVLPTKSAGAATQ